jgi:hypothetical protein
MIKTIIKSCGGIFAGVLWMYAFVESFWFFNQPSDIAIGAGIIIELALLGFLAYMMLWGAKGIITRIRKENEDASEQEK